MKRIFQLLVASLLLISGNSFGQTQPSGSSCNDAIPFCTGFGSTVTYPNSTNVPSLGSGGPYDCLFSTPNPVWYFLQMGSNGDIEITVTQTSTTGTQIDVDFVLWGPFVSTTAACANYSASNVIDCSYSASPVEIINITGGVTGQFYLLLMTNFSGQAGTMEFVQTDGNASTNCAVLCNMTALTATPSACNPATNNYSVSGNITVSNPPTTGVLTITSSCGGSVTLNPPFANSIPYTIQNINSTGGNCSVTATFSADPTCTLTQTYTSPAPCSNCTLTASNTGPVCAGGSFGLSTTSVTGATYTWTGPNGFTSNAQNPTGIIASSTNGNYTYTVTANTALTSCSTTTTVSVINPPTANFSYSSASYCKSASPNPAPVAGPGSVLGNFSASPAGLAINAATGVINLINSTPGTYTVVNSVPAAGGCPGVTFSTSVQVLPVPPTPQAGNNGPVCLGATLNVSVVNPDSSLTYNWVGPGGATYTGATVTIPAATSAHNGNYSVTYVQNGCASLPGITNAVVQTNLLPPSVASNSPVCEGQSLNLTASSTAAGATYSWVYPDGSTSTAQNPVLSPATLSISGSYTVYAIVNGCVSPASTTPVVVLPSAVAPTIFTNSPVCEGEALQLSTVLVPGASYTWTTPGGNSLIGQVVTIPGALPTDSGTYTLNTPGSSGCGSAPGTVQVVVNALPDVPAVNSNSPVCFGSTITLSTAFVAGASYTWTAPDGQSYFGQSVSIPSATAADSGTYSVQVVTAASCASAVGTGTVVVVPAVSQGNVFSSSPVCQGDSLYLFASGSWPAGAVFSWTGPNYQTSLQNPVRANAQPSYSGSYTFSVSYNGCTSTPAVLQVVVHPSPSSPQASVNAPLCEGQDLLFTATAVGGGVYSWVNPQGQHFSSLQNPVITNATPAQSGVYTLYVTNGNNCTSVTPSYLTVIVKAMPQVNAVASTPLCEGQTLLLSTPLVQNAFYSWSGPAGFASTQHNPVRTNATLSMSGTYHVWVTREGCTAEDTVHVEVVPQPSAPVPFQPGDICEGTPLTLSAAGPALGHYVWTGPVSFTGQDTVILEAGLQHQGNYQVTVSVNGCTSPIGLLQNVVVLDAPNVNAFTLTASDTLICRGDVPVTLKATGAPIYSWSAPATGGLTGNPTLSQIQASPTATTTYTLVGSNTNGCRDTAYVTIRIAEPLVAEAGPDQSGLCGQDSVSLNAVAPVLGTGVWTIASGSGGVFSDNTSAQATFRGTAGQSYSLVWTVTSAVCGSDADTVQVSLQGNVAAPTATGYEACALAEDAPQPVSLAASGSAGVYEWYADSALTGSVLSYDSVYSVSLSQTSSYWVRSVENGCAGPAVEVRAVINPLPVVDAGVDVSIEQGQSTVLYASGAASYSWSPAMGLSAANVQSPVAAPIVSTTYTVSGTDAAGCTASDEVVVSLLPALAIPNGFTPNGDGSNDVWEISALTQGYPDCRVEIFNRWGGVVYASVGYFKPWDGKLEGKELPTATYYYMIYLKPGEAPIAGSVTIVK